MVLAAILSPLLPRTSPPQNLGIQTWYDLDAVRNNLAGNHTLMNNLDSTTPGYWELASLIANQGKGWEPIGLVQLIFFDDPFGCSGGSREDWYGLSGTFDGQGYEIRDLFIDRPIENDIALFGAVDEGGMIKDIGAVNFTVIGEHYVAGLVGRNRGTVSNSYSSVSVTGDGYVGGLVGTNERGTVSNSFWDVQTSGQTRSAGGTGKTTAKMKGIATFSGAGWNIIAVASAGMRNPAYIWNIVTGVTYPFLSWQP